MKEYEVNLEAALKEYQVNFDKRINFAELIRALRKDIKVPIPSNPVAIRGACNTLYVVEGHPEIYYDDIIVLKDRLPGEIAEWLRERSPKEKKIIKYEEIKDLFISFPAAKEKVVRLKGYYKDSEGNIWAFLHYGRKEIIIIRAEYYVWLKKEGYVIKYRSLPGFRDPLVLKSNDRTVGFLMPIFWLQYYEYKEDFSDETPQKNIEVPIRKSPADICESYTFYIVENRPEIYCDGVLLLEDRTREEVEQWLKRHPEKRKIIVTYERVKIMYPQGETVPVKLKSFSRGYGIVYAYLAYLESENGEVIVVNAEYYVWLEKEGYTFKYVGVPNKPLILERNGKVVGVLATISGENNE